MLGVSDGALASPPTGAPMSTPVEELSLAARLLQGDRDDASATFIRLNNAGEGFDPTEISEWKLVWLADSTDGVAVYRDGDDAILVGTDGSGDDDSRWAVRVSA